MLCVSFGCISWRHALLFFQHQNVGTQHWNFIPTLAGSASLTHRNLVHCYCFWLIINLGAARQLSLGHRPEQVADGPCHQRTGIVHTLRQNKMCSVPITSIGHVKKIERSTVLKNDTYHCGINILQYQVENKCMLFKVKAYLY